MIDNLKKMQESALLEMQKATNSNELYQLKVKYLGKQGVLTGFMKEIASAPASEKPLLGKEINIVKTALEESYETIETILKQSELNKKLAEENIDLTLPGPLRERGGIHILNQVIDEIVTILSRVGFAVRTGPLVESDFNNFTALNIPEDHPARDMQDTFYLENGQVLRTHTSPIQVRTMLSEKPPIRILAPGSVFRCDSDATHSPNFHQIEALLVDREVSMAHLKGTISYFVKEFFGPNIKTRFRPSFFPFTEPSAEVDCSCPICEGKGCRMCKNSGWIEIGGSGLVHPKVLETSGINPNEWQGFAFGFGIERMAIIKYGITDIRLFVENDLRFLRQFES